MGNELFRDRLYGNINRCLLEAEACARLQHPGTVGQVRQILIEHLLLSLLPEGVRVGTGKIADSNGNLSAETDVIIYDRRLYHPLCMTNGTVYSL